MSSGSYRYGFNGQEKSDDIKGSGNSYTAEFWEYDPRLGRRWNRDPKPIIDVSPYATFLNNPILFQDPLGDTVINVDVARALGREKSGMDLAGNSITAGDYSLVPIQKSVNDKTIIGYNAWRNGRHEYQLDVSDLSDFSNNSSNYASTADIFYSSGTPNYDAIRYFYGIKDGDWKSVWGGFKGMWGSAFKDPIYVASLTSLFANVGVGMTSNRMQNQPIQQQQAKAGAGGFALSLKPLPVNKISNGCEALAAKIQKTMGGEFLQVTNPLGSRMQLGPVNYSQGSVNGWFHHVAVLKNGRVYDGMTGAAGMGLKDYKSMFEYANDLKFEAVKSITVK
jgi:RHS repeat-associated protein